MDDDKGRQPPDAASRETGRRRGHGVLRRTAGIALIAVLTAGSGVVSAGPARADSSADAAVRTRAAAAPLTPDSQLTPIGLGPVEVGMSVAEAERAGGVTLVPSERFGDCWYVAPEGWPESSDVSFMVIGDRIVRADAWGDSTSTSEGIRVGSTEQDVHEAYPGQVTATTDRLGQRLLLYVPPKLTHDSATSDRFVFYSIIVFQSDGHQVTGMRAGFLDAAVTFDEGCH